jgi:hypothetical protein
MIEAGLASGGDLLFGQNSGKKFAFMSIGC